MPLWRSPLRDFHGMDEGAPTSSGIREFERNLLHEREVAGSHARPSLGRAPVKRPTQSEMYVYNKAVLIEGNLD